MGKKTEIECEALEKLNANDARSSELFVTTRTTLLRRVNAGDRKAFEEFYNVYCPAMLKYLGLAEGAGTERDQLDIVQTVFARFYRTFAMVADPATGAKRVPRNLLDVMVRHNKKTGTTQDIKFRQYLLTCLKNAVRSKWRHDTHQGAVTLQSLDVEVAPDAKETRKEVVVDRRYVPTGEIARKERREREEIVLAVWPAVVRAFVLDEALDDCVRDVVYRSIAEGASSDELARKWGITKNYAYKIKCDGLKKAQKITRAIYRMMLAESGDAETDVRRLCEAVSVLKPTKHVDKFMIRLAREILDGER